MSFQLLTKARKRTAFSYLFSRGFSHRSERFVNAFRPSFGIAFDIDGVLLLGNSPVGGSPGSLKKLYGADGRLKIPYVFLTNSGGYPEAKRAFELSKLLGIKVTPSQVFCDILKTGGLPGRNVGPQPHINFANDDLEYQTKFPSERLGMGAFRIALESIFNRIHPHSLEYTYFHIPHHLLKSND